FDNIIISRYDQVHGRGSFMRDRPKSYTTAPKASFAEKLAEARVDLGAVIDFASSFGTLVLTRAYADWSLAVNAEYRGQLVGRAGRRRARSGGRARGDGDGTRHRRPRGRSTGGRGDPGRHGRGGREAGPAARRSQARGGNRSRARGRSRRAR